MADTDLTDAFSTNLYEQPVLTLDPGVHIARIWCADADMAGTYAVTGSDDKTVRIWSALTGECLRTIRLPRGPGDVGKVYALAISPDGELVAAGGWTRIGKTDKQEQIYIFDRETGALVRRIKGLPNILNHLVFSPDGRYLAAMLMGANGLRVYGREAGWDEIARDDDYDDDSYGAAFAADSRLATTSYDEHVRLYDRAFRRVAMTRTEGEPAGIAFNPEGDKLVVGYNTGNTLSLFEGRDLTPLLGPDTRGIESGVLVNVAWSADGATLHAGGAYDINRIVSWFDAGMGTRSELTVSLDYIFSLSPLPEGGLLVGAGDPYLAVLDADGILRWEQKKQQANFRGLRSTLSVSADGLVVDFGYEATDEVLARFDLAHLELSLDKPADGLTAPPDQASMKVENWIDNELPTVNGRILSLWLGKYEISRSLAIHPDGKRFVLGTESRLRAFDAEASSLWQRAVPGTVWAVNITADGRLVVAAYGDGTIRWHRMDDGSELLAFFPMTDRANWVAWTPEGIYAATPGAFGFLRWHINHGWDQAAEAIPVDEIKELRRPEVLSLVLQEMETARALGLADLKTMRHAVQIRTGSSVPPGARLHVLAIGVSDYGEKAKHLRLRYADQDAHDVASALVNTQGSLYADVSLNLLRNEEVTRTGIFQAFNAMREKLAQAEPGQDLAVVLFSGHGTIVDDGFYLLIHGVDASTAVDIKATALPLNNFRDELHKMGEQGRVLVLLDACHSGAATGDGTLLPMNSDMLRAALATTNVTVLTSSSADEISHEHESWQNGAFTEVFLEALSRADSDRDGLISVTDLTSYLTTHVPRLTENKQTPGIEVRFQRDIFVAAL